MEMENGNENISSFHGTSLSFLISTKFGVEDGSSYFMIFEYNNTD